MADDTHAANTPPLTSSTESETGQFSASPVARLTHLAEHLPLSIMLFDAHGRVEYVNRWHVEVINQGRLPASFFLGLTMRELPGLASAGVADALGVVFQGKRVFMDEVRVPRLASGRSGYQRLRCLPLFENDDETAGKVCGAVLIREDITAHMLGKRRLQEAESKYRTIFETAPVGIFLTTLDGRFLEMNRAMAAMLGYATPAEAMAAITNIATDCYTDPAVRDALIQELRQHGTILGVEREFKRRDGGLFSATLHAHFVYDEHGAPLHLEGMLTDTTTRRRTEEALKQAKQTAEQANAAKSVFLATISHDLRTPLHHILGMAELAAGEATTPAQREYFRLQRLAGEHLLALVDDLLDLSLIEADKLELVTALFSLDELAENLRTLFFRQAQDKGLALSIHIDPDCHRIRQGDCHRLRQVLVNLVGNAIKFTSTGSVVVTIQAMPDAVERLLFQVRDTGPGIPLRRQHDIFKPYIRLQSTEHVGGTGLGLAIASNLVHRMGGTLDLDSEPDQGSRFHFILPLSPGTLPESQHAPPAVAASPLPQRVLIVEDEPVSRLYSLKVLEKAGLLAMAVADGAGALQLLAGQRFDAVILDMHLPDMDGLKFLRTLRKPSRKYGRKTSLPALPWATPADTPVLVVTAQAMRGDGQRILKAGANGYLAKPVNSEQLLEALGRLQRPAPPPQAPDTP